MLSNLIRTDPETARAQREERAAAREARQEEIARLRTQLDKLSDQSYTSHVLPEDVEVSKRFLRGRIEKIQTSSSLTEEQLAALNETRESVQHANLVSAYRARWDFKTHFTELNQKYKTLVAEATAKGETVSPDYTAGVKVTDAALKWFSATQYELPEDYEDEQRKFELQFREKTDGKDLEDPDRVQRDASMEARRAREEFSVGDFFKKLFGYMSGWFILFVLSLLVVLGASLASNLNIYRDWPFRLLYAIYGGLFFFLVIPYTLFYRWAWLQKRPRFYALIPLFPYHWDGRIAQLLLSWMSFRPDDAIGALREWENESSS